MDIRTTGSVQYEVHTGDTDTLISQTSSFISEYYGSEFVGEWLLVAEWNRVPPFPGNLATVVGYTYSLSQTLSL